MSALRIELPDEVRNSLSLSEKELSSLALEALLVRLVERGEISTGKAAELLGVSKRAFLDILGTYGVSPFDDESDLAAESNCG